MVSFESYHCKEEGNIKINFSPKCYFPRILLCQVTYKVIYIILTASASLCPSYRLLTDHLPGLLPDIQVYQQTLKSSCNSNIHSSKLNTKSYSLGQWLRYWACKIIILNSNSTSAPSVKLSNKTLHFISPNPADRHKKLVAGKIIK